MRSHRHAYPLRGLSVAAVAAVLACSAIEPAEAQRRGGFGMGGNMGMQRPMMRQTTMPRMTGTKMVNPNYGSKMGGSRVVGSKWGSKVGSKTGSKWATNPGKDGGGRKPPKGPVVGERTPEPGAGRPPRWPGRYPRPGWVPPVVVGTGVAIGTGIAVGTAVAAPLPPPPPPVGGMAAPQIPAGPLGSAINIPPPNENRFVPNEVVLEFPGNLSPQAIVALGQRHRLARLDSVTLPSTGTTFFRARIVDGRPVRVVLAGLRRETQLRAGQPNYLFTAAQQASSEQSVTAPAAPLAVEPSASDQPAMPPAAFTPPPAATPAPTPVVASASALPALGGDPAQYALTKLRLQEAHSLTKGNNVLVAVIDSGIDAGHPELRGVIAGTFDALGKAEKPHAHGTGIAGTIAARSRLMGVAPAARILAIRAFGNTGASAEATTFAIIKGLEHAMAQHARVINMSFNGPADPGMARQIANARARGIVLVAAAGNLGEKSPPQYPAADPNVIAVSATDAEDKLFKASNRGRHIAVSAPGVDILVPSPDANYQVISGTSFAAAHVSGVVALILERKPNLDPDSIRKVLLATAKDLGPVGPDEQFGAGLADAYQALLALEPRTVAGPDVTTEPKPATAQ